MNKNFSAQNLDPKRSQKRKLNTLVRLMMTGYIEAVKIMAGINMAEWPKNRQRSVYLSHVNYLSSFNYDGLYCGG